MDDEKKTKLIRLPNKMLVINNLINEYLAEFDKICLAGGVFLRNADEGELVKEFLNRFYSNIVSLQNSLNLKDSLHATLLQRYNYELIVDFFYLFKPKGEIDKLEKFFNFEQRSVEGKSREWSTFKHKDKTEFLPDLKNTGEHYRILSTFAHSNIMSMRLNRRGDSYEYQTILMAVALVLTGINICLEEKKLLDKFTHININKIKLNMHNITLKIVKVRDEYLTEIKTVESI